MEPQTLSHLNPSDLLPTAITEDLDVACSMVQVQPQVPSALETPLVKSSIPREFEQSSAAQSQTLRDFEKVSWTWKVLFFLPPRISGKFPVH